MEAAMQPYWVHSRALVSKNPTNPVRFPGPAKINFHLEPQRLFGVGHDFGRFTIEGKDKTNVEIDANFGSVQLKSDTPLRQLGFSSQIEGNDTSLNKSILTVVKTCDSANALHTYISHFYLRLGPILSIRLPEPVVVSRVDGDVNGAPFAWEFGMYGDDSELRINFICMSADRSEAWIEAALHLLPQLKGDQGIRVLHACSFFMNAMRLNLAGTSLREFMAEHILNLAKVLQVLFVHSSSERDDVRKGLRAVGICKAEIEGVFIPVLLLRSSLGVAHPKLTIPAGQIMDEVREFIEFAEGPYRKMLWSVATKCAVGGLELPARDAVDSGGDLRIIRKIISQYKVLRAKSGIPNDWVP
jgi:hypothetical protein